MLATIACLMALQSDQGTVRAPTLRFVDATAEVGFAHVHSCSPTPHLCDMMGGVAVGDFDADGWPDLFVVGGEGGTPDRLYLNDRDGTFTDQAAKWGVARRHRGVGATVGDVDGNGYDDLFVSSVGDLGSPSVGRNLLYLNQGGWFVEVAAAAGVDHNSTSFPDSFGAAFGDVDLDGDLDLFTTSWTANAWNAAEGNRLFLNDGTGAFTDVTGGPIQVPRETWGFGPTICDMDGDRWPEILLAADFTTSRYWVNQGGGAFVETTAASGLGLDGNGMGSAVADFDGDGLLDWYVTSIHGPATGPGVAGDGNKLYLNRGGHQYVEAAVDRGCAEGRWGWGTVAEDLDLDGDVDLAEVNGFVLDPYRSDPARLWLNDGAARFREVGASVGFAYPGDDRGLVALDADRDGDLDLVVAEHAGALRFHRNEAERTGHAWLDVRLDTSARPHLAPRGRGSRIEVTAGGRTQVRVPSGGATYLGCSELGAFFGLGDATVVDRLEVHWNDGTSTVRTNLVPRRRVVVAP